MARWDEVLIESTSRPIGPVWLVPSRRSGVIFELEAEGSGRRGADRCEVKVELLISNNAWTFGLRHQARHGLLMLAIFFCGNAWPAEAGTSGPKIVVAEYRHDFGEAFAGQFMDHVFTIRNEGTAPLSLSDEVRHAPNALGNSVSSPTPIGQAKILVARSSGFRATQDRSLTLPGNIAKGGALGFAPPKKEPAGAAGAVPAAPAPT